MNYTTAIFLINKGVRAILATYDPDLSGSTKATMFKTLDQDIKVDDILVVPSSTRHKMTTVKVTAVDIDVDFDNATAVDWVVGKVDRAPYDVIAGQEAVAIQKIKSAELQRKRKDLASSLLADSMDEIKALPIADMNGAKG